MSRQRSARQGDFQLLLKRTVVVHLDENVGSPHEFTLHINLGNGGPIGEFLDALSDLHVGEHIKGFKTDPECVQNLHHVVGETALGHQFGAFHEHEDRARLDQVLDFGLRLSVHGIG